LHVRLVVLVEYVEYRREWLCGNTCRKCDSETHLNEALSELSSAQTIISILQNELIFAKASASSEPDTEVWKLVAYNNNNNNNNKVKSQKRDKLSWSELHHLITLSRLQTGFLRFLTY
jgi:hypothetical protein